MRHAARRRVWVLFVAAAVVAAGLSAAAAATATSAPSGDELDGKLLVAHGDDFATGAMSMSAMVRTKSGNVRLRVTAARHNELMSLAGRQVRVRGINTAAGFNAATIAAVDSAPAAAPRAMRIAVVLLHTKGSTAEPITTAAAQSTFFAATNSVADWFGESSSGAVSVTGRVFGWYNSNYAPADCNNSGSMLSSFLTEAKTQAAHDGYVSSDFDNVVVYTPRFNGSGCGFSGMGWVGASGVLLNGAMGISVAAHELGHNLGLWHAGIPGCSASNVMACYGDPYDTMGNLGSRTYNGPHKYTLGWLPADQVRNVTTGTQTINLTASEFPLAGSTELILLPGPGGKKYAIERRASHGRYDQGLSGVWVRLMGKSSDPYDSDDTQLLDMTPSTSSYTDGNLAAGKTFTDAATNITIKTVTDNVADPTASVQVCVGVCGSPPPPPVTTTTTSTSTSTSTTRPTSTTTTMPTSTTTTTRPTTPPPSTVTVFSQNGTVFVVGSNGNDTIRAWRSRSHRVSITAGSPIVLGTGCSIVNGAATCTGDAINIDGGAGDDIITVDGSARATINGNTGNDRMIGGRAADVFIGGTGIDTVDYSSRVGQRITGTPGTGADDGKSREKDDIRGDVEQVVFPNASRRSR